MSDKSQKRRKVWVNEYAVDECERADRYERGEHEEGK